LRLKDSKYECKGVYFIYKTCSKCKQSKLTQEFIKRLESKDGLRGVCRDCINKNKRYRYLNNINGLRTKSLKDGLEYRQSEQYRVTYSNYKLTSDKIRIKASHKKYEVNNRKKFRVKKNVRDAIMSGKLTRGRCEICDTAEDIHGHHDDYNYPLKVRWLCRKHHMEWHRLNGKGLNGD